MCTGLTPTKLQHTRSILSATQYTGLGVSPTHSLTHTHRHTQTVVLHLGAAIMPLLEAKHLISCTLILGGKVRSNHTPLELLTLLLLLVLQQGF